MLSEQAISTAYHPLITTDYPMQTYGWHLARSELFVTFATLVILPIKTLLGSPLPSLAQNSDAVGSQIYEQASPAVVNIRTNNGSGSEFIVTQDGLTITNELG